MNIFKRFDQAYEIDKDNREQIIAWLEDKRDFHKWFTSLIVGSFVALTIFGKKPGLDDVSGLLLTSSLALLLFSILCNLVCVWSIPGWKLGVGTGRITNNFRMKIELDVPAWSAVICFVSGLTLGFLGNTGA